MTSVESRTKDYQRQHSLRLRADQIQGALQRKTRLRRANDLEAKEQVFVEATGAADSSRTTETKESEVSMAAEISEMSDDDSVAEVDAQDVCRGSLESVQASIGAPII